MYTPMHIADCFRWKKAAARHGPLRARAPPLQRGTCRMRRQCRSSWRQKTDL